MSPRGVRNATITAAVAAWLLAGCAADPLLPRTRIGSLPFPGMFSLYEVADPDELGVHRADATLLRLGASTEADRGTLYTRRAGFIDLCHIREAVDWTRYFYAHLRPRLQSAGSPDAPSSFMFHYVETRFEVVVHAAGEPGTPLPSETLDDLAIRASQRLALAVTTWHEIATWLGFQTVPGVSERHSAFTWDDTTAHALGVLIGGEALRRRGVDWDIAVTDALDHHLQGLEPTDPAELRGALASVRGRWWARGVAIRRDFDTGLGAAVKHPWRPPDACGPAAVIALPPPVAPDGRTLDSIVQLRISPPHWMARRLRSTIADPTTLQGESGVQSALEHVRADMRRRLGDEFDRP